MGINFSNGSSTSGLVADLWRSTTDHQGNTTPLPNWERPDSGNQSYIVGMSESSGVFTFPSTGVYLIQFWALMFLNNTTTKSQRCGAGIQITVDNANYTGAATGDVHFGGGGYSNSIDTQATASAALMFDVTDTSNQKVRFTFGAGQGHEKVAGNSSHNRTWAVFTRMGDT